MVDPRRFMMAFQKVMLGFTGMGTVVGVLLTVKHFSGNENPRLSDSRRR